MNLEVLFAIYTIADWLFTFLGFYLLQSEITALERELDVLLEELIKLKKEVEKR